MPAGWSLGQMLGLYGKVILLVQSQPQGRTKACPSSFDVSWTVLLCVVRWPSWHGSRTAQSHSPLPLWALPTALGIATALAAVLDYRLAGGLQGVTSVNRNLEPWTLHLVGRTCFLPGRIYDWSVSFSGFSKPAHLGLCVSYVTICTLAWSEVDREAPWATDHWTGKPAKPLNAPKSKMAGEGGGGQS